eukprot:7107126-Lingulodinium_polyedra.AAC.1
MLRAAATPTRLPCAEGGANRIWPGGLRGHALKRNDALEQRLQGSRNVVGDRAARPRAPAT